MISYLKRISLETYALGHAGHGQKNWNEDQYEQPMGSHEVHDGGR